MLKSFVIGAAAIAALAGPAQAATVVNEDFTGGFGAFTAEGNVGLADGQIYNQCCQTDPSNLNSFVAFGGNNLPSGSITTSFFAAANQLYALTFDYSALGSGSETLSGVFGSQAFSFTPTANAALVYQSARVLFTGTGSQATLSFTSNGINDVDAILDNVNVTAVPEPSTWAMLLFGFGVIGYGLRKRTVRHGRLQIA